ncbi:phosphotransferase family protein [Actinomadura viridis]|uniref:phosphotransferase family protein n=1 Tax=Actinomadura viridis TaxID=58110 RepID=UPI00368C40E2
MRYEPISRPADAFQRTVTAEQITAICERAFGSSARVVAAVELGGGLYNTTFRLELPDTGPVILRVAPEPGAQSRTERELMRGEYAALPFLAPLAPLLPRLLFADFSHQVIGRDYLVQSVLEGVPAPEGLASYPRERWGGFYRQLGELTARVHALTGDRFFGPVAGPGYARWSDALIAGLADTAADLEDAGVDASDLRTGIAAADAGRSVLDRVTVPRLTAGDLWVPNVMLGPAAAEPRICGMWDIDRAWWADPASDWGVFQAACKPGTETDAFWDGYGQLEQSRDAAWRSLIYQARHWGRSGWSGTGSAARTGSPPPATRSRRSRPSWACSGACGVFTAVALGGR